MSKRPLTLIAALVLAAGLTACGGEDETAADSPPVDNSNAVPCTYTEEGGAAKDADLPPDSAADDGDVPVTITASAGEVTATLDAAAAPCTVNSFTSLAGQGYFDGTPCHRLTTNPVFGVLQCGDPSGTGGGGPGYSFGDELTGEETYPAGTLAMANAGPDTNGSQFFMVYVDTQLSADYTVFGTIDPEGVQVVADLAADGVDGGGEDGPPATPVTIESVSVD
ncbi:hypothetical protein NPS01_17990 [Nocardioides psychrotolerans]|uniref:Peptidyl-prolyl cis-trans isomerase n=1 Tax=Nocardioides psychrotolerans TaxID=1005945 RepID=A0A1I3JK92_9ACTN|nr:peptidylprolyl isomerase [Nocardioides psychrotolerans]GEP38136.1 hypothetical protein NPS01_17990 [Nocardioides psychrotolerans]SFI60295.1 peptidyl-prolyl cis-trans isomerase B (cyclophilin B) [Nocardioides psychrotolerans]